MLGLSQFCEECLGTACLLVLGLLATSLVLSCSYAVATSLVSGECCCRYVWISHLLIAGRLGCRRSLQESINIAMAELAVETDIGRITAPIFVRDDSIEDQVVLIGQLSTLEEKVPSTCWAFGLVTAGRDLSVD